MDPSLFGLCLSSGQERIAREHVDLSGTMTHCRSRCQHESGVTSKLSCAGHARCMLVRTITPEHRCSASKLVRCTPDCFASRAASCCKEAHVVKKLTLESTCLLTGRSSCLCIQQRLVLQSVGVHHLHVTCEWLLVSTVGFMKLHKMCPPARKNQ